MTLMGLSNNMLELQKYVLKNVSEDKRLFKKELIKSKKWLNERDLSQLMVWVKENFWDTHRSEIEEVSYNQYQKV
jgi:hypothetical protein